MVVFQLNDHSNLAEASVKWSWSLKHEFAVYFLDLDDKAFFYSPMRIILYQKMIFYIDSLEKITENMNINSDVHIDIKIQQALILSFRFFKSLWYVPTS